MCAYQASFIFVHDGRGCLLNASVIFFLGEVGEGSLTQQFTVKFIEVIINTYYSCSPQPLLPLGVGETGKGHDNTNNMMIIL